VSAVSGKGQTHKPEVVGLEAETSIDTGNYVAVQEYLAVQDYLAIQAYLTALEETRIMQEATAAAAAKQQVRQNTGAHSDAWWRGVSVCEQSGNNNPYYGYFSIMDGSAGGLDWSTQVAMANQIISRAGDNAWASKCVQAGYAASPNG